MAFSIVEYFVRGPVFWIAYCDFVCGTGSVEILEGTGGHLVKAPDVDGLAKAIMQLIHHPEEREAISALSLEKAKRYQADHIVDEWFKLLDSDSHWLPK